ncbi:MAG: hypothetical protein GWN58_35300 [Anaerolineae bacterium]|nr:hypothetical protein [Anaerolineae bacterium]
MSDARLRERLRAAESPEDQYHALSRAGILLVATVVQVKRNGRANASVDIRIARQGVSARGLGAEARCLQVIEAAGQPSGMGPRSALRQALEGLSQQGIHCPFLLFRLAWERDNPGANADDWRKHYRSVGLRKASEENRPDAYCAGGSHKPCRNTVPEEGQLCKFHHDLKDGRW